MLCCLSLRLASPPTELSYSSVSFWAVSSCSYPCLYDRCLLYMFAGWLETFPRVVPSGFALDLPLLCTYCICVGFWCRWGACSILSSIEVNCTRIVLPVLSCIAFFTSERYCTKDLLPQFASLSAIASIYTLMQQYPDILDSKVSCINLDTAWVCRIYSRLCCLCWAGLQD